MFRGELEAAGDPVVHDLALEASQQRKHRSALIRPRKDGTRPHHSRTAVLQRSMHSASFRPIAADRSLVSIEASPRNLHSVTPQPRAGPLPSPALERRTSMFYRHRFASASAGGFHSGGAVSVLHTGGAQSAIGMQSDVVLDRPDRPPDRSQSYLRHAGPHSPSLSQHAVFGGHARGAELFETTSFGGYDAFHGESFADIPDGAGGEERRAPRERHKEAAQTLAQTCRARCWTCLARVPFGGCATLEGTFLVVLLVLALLVLIGASTVTGYATSRWPRSLKDEQNILFFLMLGLWGLFVALIVLTVLLCVLSSKLQVDFSGYPKLALQDAPGAPQAPLRGDLLALGGRWLVDAEGRAVIPRGVNFTGGCKMPLVPDGLTHLPGGLSAEPGGVSFVGRPVPLDKADEHFARLRAWGLTFLRLLVTWEAVEHAGPGKYDEEYLAYLVSFVRKAHEYGISVFVDPHQDCWSRWTGGDGAPGWTLEAAGFDLQSLDSSGAAMTHQAHGDPFPKMAWVSNYSRLACCTMFTIFWAGDTYAPQRKAPDGGSLQDFLQRHFVHAMLHIARALRHEPNVVGFETLNEPSPGWAGREAGIDKWGFPPVGFMSGPRLCPLDAMAAGAGMTIESDVWAEPLCYSGRVNINPHGKCAWLGGPENCVWRQHGVWQPVGPPGQQKAQLLKPDHFRRKADGTPYKFMEEFFEPFLNRFKEAILSVIPDALIFVESPIWLEFDGEVRAPTGFPPEKLAEGVIWAPHYYDGITLLTKNFRRWCTIDEQHLPVFGGRDAVQKSFARVVESHRCHADEVGETGIPSIIGETGVPMDMCDGAAYRDGDFSTQCLAIDTVISAIESCHLPFTLWCYTPENTNKHGDGWNGEDFSIWSKDQQSDPADLHSGGRVLPAVCRPYAIRTAGEPISVSFEPFKPDRRWEYRFSTKDLEPIPAPTVIFVPQYQYMYPEQLVVHISDGAWEINWDIQQLLWVTDPKVTDHHITIRRNWMVDPPKKRPPKRDQPTRPSLPYGHTGGISLAEVMRSRMDMTVSADRIQSSPGTDRQSPAHEVGSRAVGMNAMGSGGLVTLLGASDDDIPRDMTMPARPNRLSPHGTVPTLTTEGTQSPEGGSPF
eukprot:TRINITY_DN1804_c0_g1_i2.p1 TRINITY_DN1804_c0_g1~~TRINITY_DN1804_c0_g1_i2.p1  ORF type:complete len:1147 (+),score=260.03 TRINITY_DN1804_c0_g1_i2:102-3443(+)